MVQIEVRPFSRADRAALYRIAADTAFFGEPVEAFLDDRRLFCDAFYSYYADVEPEHSWVACVRREVVGFIAGCVDTKRQQRWWGRRVLPRVMGRALRGRYRLGRLTWRFTFRLVGSVLRGESTHVDLDAYPAHLHINVDWRWRGRGAGQRLIEAYLEQLRQLRVAGVHLNTTNLNRAACLLYEKTGFQLLDSCASHTWSHLVARAVENRSYGLRLA